MENIQVILRVRPQNNQELESNDPNIWTVFPPSNISLTTDRHIDLMKSRKISVGHKTDFNFSTNILYD